MADYSKVFQSEIPRSQTHNVDDLHELLDVTAAVPTHVNKEQVVDFDFVPNTDKRYVPKKRSKLKVKSVRDLRQTFENDVLSYLPSEIKKQEECLMKKIKSGSAKDRHTKKIAKSMLMSDRPMSKAVLQMLMNINPDDEPYNVQYVLYKGKKIRLNGSTGGKHLIHIDYDLSRKKVFQNKNPKSTNFKKKNGLLQNSLAVKFKPGPLVKKKSLDVSYQKYNVGVTELVNLPQPVLRLQPVAGLPLEPSLTKFVQNYCKYDGTISEKWAEFSVSAVDDSDCRMPQSGREDSVTFDLNYACNQKRILMRRDIDNICNITQYDKHKTSHPPEDLMNEITAVVNKMLDAVEIHVIQEDLYTKDDVENIPESPVAVAILPKDKKKRRFFELDKLDVTVIQLPDEVRQEVKKEECTNSFCALGCVCSSLQNPFNIKQHCGKVKCMFQCQCKFSKYAVDYFGNSELLPGIINLDKKINCQLAKEQMKFHQTVVVTGSQSIVLKTKKRMCKVSQRYADYYSNKSSKPDVKLQQDVSIDLVKLNCENIETWCMKHRLYRCFCKGKFTHSAVADTEVVEANVTTDHIHPEGINKLNSRESNINMNSTKYNPTPEKAIDCKLSESDTSEIKYEQLTDHCIQDRCARAITYTRKYQDSFYSEMQNKIKQMEQNDESLRKRLQQLIDSQLKCSSNKSIDGLAESKEKVKKPKMDMLPYNLFSKFRCKSPAVSHAPCGQNATTLQHFQQSDPIAEGQIKNSTQSANHEQEKRKSTDLPAKRSLEIQQEDLTRFIGSHETGAPTQDKAKLIAWLENSYKQYKKRSQGKIVLEPPKNKKLVIYPWDFILSRYKQKKNIFLVTKNMPFRLFMAVDIKDSFFDNCMNVKYIPPCEFNKYPVTVQRLLKSDTKNDDNFCILLGLNCCWEFVGSLSKVGEGTSNRSKGVEQNPIVHEISDDSDTIHMDVEEQNDSKFTQTTSYWFVLMIEPDFNEIQFSDKGFFVRYLSIIKAVNVARLSGKTVRLSSHSSGNNTDTPQFGVYAIPSIHDYCVFIGPCQNDKDLKIEIIKSDVITEKKTTGFWISTKKDENFLVIENPLSFLPKDRYSVEYVTLDEIPERPYSSMSSLAMRLNKIGVLENSSYKPPITTVTSKSSSLVNDTVQTPQSSTPTTNTSSGDVANDVNNVISDVSSTKAPILIESKQPEPITNLTTIKPIRISKENGFYKILPKLGFKTVHSDTNTSGLKSLKPICVPAKGVHPEHPKVSSACATSSAKPITPKQQFPPLTDKIKPVAEIAPQIKIVNVYSESTAQPRPQQSSQRNEIPGRGMFVLKPEEINQKVMKATGSTSDQSVDDDIENFLATTENVRMPPNSLLMYSDEDDTLQDVKDVFIECTNLDHIGWIKGKIDRNGHISFKFPGFKYTNFYPKPKAYEKINQVLSKKVYVPKSIKMQWRVVTTREELDNKNMLTSQQVGADLVLTKRGMKCKGDLISYAARSKWKVKVFSAASSSSSSATTREETAAFDQTDHDIEKASEALLDQGSISEEMEYRNSELLRELTTQPEVYRQNPITNELTTSQREQMAERLQDLLVTTDADEEAIDSLLNTKIFTQDNR